LLNAVAASRAAPKVAVLLADRLGRSKSWIEEQTQEFQALAKIYTL
jgi:hypothetical protein